MKTLSYILRGGARCLQRAFRTLARSQANVLRTSRSTSTLALLTLLVFAHLIPAAHAQWQTTTYSLTGGWNSIYLHGDSTHVTPDQLFASNPEIIEVWRWNPNPNSIQFSSSPLIPSNGTPEWSVWLRGNPAQTTLVTLNGQTAYLVRCTGTTSDAFSIAIPQKIRPPRSTWVRNGANFLGFPTRLNGDYPLFSTYFATFPAAIAADTRVYRYVGGPLGPSNPVQVFSPAAERVDRTRAYWFELPVVGNFYAPLEISPSAPDGLHYGRNSSTFTVRVRNRTAAAVTLTVAPVDSAAAPVGQEAIVGRVPLLRRTFTAGSASYTDTAVTTAFNEVIGPQSTIELTFGLDRSLMTGANDAFYASFLRFTDSGSLLDIPLPVSARKASLAGLWVGDITVSNVGSTVPGSSGSGTARSFPLRVLLHVDSAGTTRLLSQVFLGQLAPAPHDLGLCTRESGLKADAKGSATRLMAAQLPLDTEISTGSGTVSLGSTLVRSFTVLFNDRTNPFVHAYHPDHDNKDARFAPLAAGVESYTYARALTFQFAATPPAGTSPIGWGATLLGGNYSETITGVHKQTLTVTGTFELRRVSDIGAITLN